MVWEPHRLMVLDENMFGSRDHKENGLHVLKVLFCSSLYESPTV